MAGEIKTPPFSAAACIEAGTLLRRLQLGENIGLPHVRPMPSRRGSSLDRDEACLGPESSDPPGCPESHPGAACKDARVKPIACRKNGSGRLECVDGASRAIPAHAWRNSRRSRPRDSSGSADSRGVKTALSQEDDGRFFDAGPWVASKNSFRPFLPSHFVDLITSANTFTTSATE